MPTDCSADRFAFAPVDGRAVVAGFDGGAITSDAGTLLLGAQAGDQLGPAIRGLLHGSPCGGPGQHGLATLVGQRAFALALGYEDLVDHDALRHDPVLAATPATSPPVAPAAGLAGKWTVNRLEHAPRRGADALHKIGHDAGAIERLFVELFLDAHKTPPEEIVSTWTPPTIRCTAPRRAGSSTAHGCYCYLPLYVFCGDHLLAAKLRRSDSDASAGAVAEVGRLVSQIRARWPHVDRFARQFRRRPCRVPWRSWPRSRSASLPRLQHLPTLDGAPSSIHRRQGRSVPRRSASMAASPIGDLREDRPAAERACHLRAGFTVNFAVALLLFFMLGKSTSWSRSDALAAGPAPTSTTCRHRRATNRECRLTATPRSSRGAERGDHDEDRAEGVRPVVRGTSRGRMISSTPTSS